eukprot:7577601-Pyramimonas_sp.AAC.1
MSTAGRIIGGDGSGGGGMLKILICAVLDGPSPFVVEKLSWPPGVGPWQPEDRQYPRAELPAFI